MALQERNRLHIEELKEKEGLQAKKLAEFKKQSEEDLRSL